MACGTWSKLTRRGVGGEMEICIFRGHVHSAADLLCSRDRRLKQSSGDICIPGVVFAACSVVDIKLSRCGVMDKSRWAVNTDGLM